MVRRSERQVRAPTEPWSATGGADERPAVAICRSLYRDCACDRARTGPCEAMARAARAARLAMAGESYAEQTAQAKRDRDYGRSLI